MGLNIILADGVGGFRYARVVSHDVIKDLLLRLITFIENKQMLSLELPMAHVHHYQFTPEFC